MPLGLGQAITASDISANVAVEKSGGRVSFSNQYSADLDGVNDKVTYSLNFWQTLLGSNSFSLSYWVKHADVFRDNNSNPSNGLQNSIGFSNGQLESFQLGLVYGPDHSNSAYRNRMNFQTLDAGGQATPFNTFSTDLSSILSDDTWYHVVYTSAAGPSSRTGKIYINGVDRTGTDTSNALDVSGVDPGVGAIGTRTVFGTDSEFTEMNIDDLSVYNTVLSSSDVTAIYNSGAPADESSRSGLIGYWRFGDGDTITGTTVLDQSTNSNNFTLVGSTFKKDVPS